MNIHHPGRFCDQSFEFIRSRFESLLVHTDCLAKCEYIHACAHVCFLAHVRKVGREGGREGGENSTTLFSFLLFIPARLFLIIYFFVLHTLELCETTYTYIIYIYGEIFWRGILIVGNIRSSSFLLPSLRDDSIGINRWKLLNPLFLTLISYI